MSFFVGDCMAKKKSSAYWKDRFEILEEASNGYGQDAYRKIEPAFDKAQRQIQKEIEAWYGRYARNNNISIDEARKHLTSAELKELKWDVQEYIKYGRENDLNQQWMKELENASAKFHINRLEALKLRTQHAMEVAFGNELDEIDAMARKVFSEDYYHSIFEVQKGFNVGWEIGQIDERKLEKIISKPWTTDNRTFKDRIWTSKDKMVTELHQQLTRNMVLGKAPDEAIKELSKYVDKDIKNAKYAAGRLVMTEQAYFHSVAQKEAFTDLDVEEFEIVATLDSHTSEVCQDMDGEHFPMKEYEPGVTAPPFHVFCRSVTVPYFDDEFSLGERAARDEDGNTYYVPSDMKYKDWKKSLVDGDVDGLIPDEPVKVESKIDALNREMQELDEKMEASTDFDEMMRIQSRQDEIKEEISKLKKIESEQLQIQTIQEASDAINQVGIFEKEVDLKNCDVKSAEAIVDVTERVAKEFPDVKLKSMRISESNMKGSTITSADSLGKTTGTSIVFNGQYFKNYDSLSEKLQARYKMGKASTKTVEGVVAHEYGHAICNAYDIKEIDIVHEIMINRGFDPKKGMPKSKFDDIFHISDYGDSSPVEWFGECFADYMENEKPKKISIEMMGIFKRMVGIKK